jgi:hypothetical protein
MPQRRWSMSVRDDHGRTHRGAVLICDGAPGHYSERAAFNIVLLLNAATPPEPPSRAAVCIPRGATQFALPARIDDLRLPEDAMAAYRGGVIVAAARPMAAAEDFPAGSDRPRLDVLALAVVAAAEAETLAPYTALIRRELAVPAGADPLAALERRLHPSDPKEALPRRAPAIMRLRSALKSLQRRAAPDATVETFAADLRFLTLFDETPLPRDAMERLLRDVQESAPRDRASESTQLHPRARQQ